VTTVPGGGDAVAGEFPPIRVLAKSFNPDNLTVQRGKEVTFVVEEGDQHTITIGGNRKSDVLKKGDTFTWEPERPGDYFITCDFVPEMRAAITTP
jgi:plastocyanin